MRSSRNRSTCRSTALSADALRGVVEEFVGRDGTDYGCEERTLDEKVRDVLRQLERAAKRRSSSTPRPARRPSSG